MGCSQPPKLEYREYTEGPHVFINADGSMEMMYFQLKDSLWSSSDQSLMGNNIIKVDNPILPPFDVKLRNTLSFYPTDFPSCSKMTVISDIEGNLSSLIRLLSGQGVIDEKGNWTYGNGHLVMLGDLFDRGPDVTPLLWLLYKLEHEAEESNGKVHILLGNHETMIFQGDIRYIHSKYKKQTADLGISYDSLYSMNTILGQWLRHKPAIIKINNLLLSHAGISPEVMALNLKLDTLNEVVRKTNLNQLSVSENPISQELFGNKGIFWYRDWVDSPVSEAELDRILEFYTVDHMIIGHTIVPSIKSQYNQKLIAIDLKNPAGSNKGLVYAFGYENDQFFVFNSEGNRELIEN
jgi:hypothetical protein